jgi:hypothetical protein
VHEHFDKEHLWNLCKLAWGHLPKVHGCAQEGACCEWHLM